MVKLVCDSKLKITVCALLVLSLIVFSDVQFFLYPPSYSSLRLDYLFSPLAYLTGFILFRFVVKPRRQKSDVNFNGLVSDKFQKDNSRADAVSGASHLLMHRHGNAFWCRIFQFFRHLKILGLNEKLHMSNSAALTPASDQSSIPSSHRKKSTNMRDCDLRQNLLLWQAEERHCRRVLKDTLLDHKRYFPQWFEAAKFLLLLRATYLGRRIGSRLTSSVGIKLHSFK